MNLNPVDGSRGGLPASPPIDEDSDDDNQGR